MSEPSTITVTAAAAAIASTMADVMGLDPTMIIWGFLGALLLVSRDTSDHEHRISRAILLLLGGAIISGGLGGLAMALLAERVGVAPVPLKIAIGVTLGAMSQAIVSGGATLISAAFGALSERIRGWLGGNKPTGGDDGRG